MPLSSGARLGRYEIRSLLGAGGMGEVYLAHDMKLDRAVALKILPAEVAAEEKRMQRFIQEARAASALNHPNIITIHEVEQIDSTHFIATEFIDGETLRERLARGRLKLSEALDISLQVAAALAAAHAAGIVHRDIKPENIMLRRDGYAKVLDFGLAKLTERPTADALDTEAPTRALVNTDPGTVMGTVAYMSPEQARGAQVDARTDIWSLGVALYEMAAGRMPFAGETPSHIIVAITDKEPPLLARYAPEAPEALEWIVTKALAKDPEERYQSAKGMLVDLRRLKQRLELSAEIERSVTPEEARDAEAEQRSSAASRSREGATGASQATVEAARRSTMRSGAEGAAPALSSAEYLAGGIKRHKLMAAVAALLFIAAAGALTFALYRFMARGGEPAAPPLPPSTMRITRLTSEGPVNSLTISPDGKYIVYATRSPEGAHLWVRQISTNSVVQIIPPAAVTYRGTTFTSDGEHIYYVARDESNPRGSLYRIPVLGGTPRRLLSDIASPVTLSPDGAQLAFIRYPDTNTSSLMLANSDGSGERLLAAREGTDWFGESGPAWSPDGRVIACGAGSDVGVSHITLAEVSVAAGEQKPLTTHRWRGSAHRAAWLSDGSGLVVAASENEAAGDQTGNTQIWHVSYPAGEVRRVTNDLNGYGTYSLGLTADDSAIATVQSETTGQIWATTLEAHIDRPRRISNGRYDGLGGLSLMPDGRIVYATSAGGNPDIWLMNGDGSGSRQLTTDPRVDAWPAVSPDGRHIVFHSDRTGISRIWRMETDGSNLRQLTDGDAPDFAPRFSPDGQWIIFQAYRDNLGLGVWRVPVDGGVPQRLIDNPASMATISPDGALIACLYLDQSASAMLWRGALVPSAGGPPVRLFDGLPAHPGYAWTPDGRALIYTVTRNAVSNFWRQPVEGGPPTQLTNFDADLIFSFALARDGRQLIFSRGTQTSDAVLIRDFR